MTDLKFEEFPKIPRLKREVVITEKIDGSNAQVAFFELNDPELFNEAYADPYCLEVFPGKQDGDSPIAMYAGSRTRWINAENDNYGFAKWVKAHSTELFTLGLGRHYGEWYGLGINRNYGLREKKFALFNVARWNPENPNRPACCQVVPILARGDSVDDQEVMENLSKTGSVLVPGYQNPEGIVVWHSASRQMYKRTFEHDGGKWNLN
jgi:hypothetical protein